MPSFNIFVFLVFFQKSDKTLKFSATLASQFFQKNVPCVALFLWASSSFIRTMSPTASFRCSLFHFVRTWRFWIYPRLHLVQNGLARNCNFLHLCRTQTSCVVKVPGRVFCVSSIAGVNGKGSSMSDGIAVIGRALIIAATSDIRVTSNSWVSCRAP